MEVVHGKVNIYTYTLAPKVGHPSPDICSHGAASHLISGCWTPFPLGRKIATDFLAATAQGFTILSYPFSTVLLNHGCALESLGSIFKIFVLGSQQSCLFSRSREGHRSLYVIKLPLIFVNVLLWDHPSTAVLWILHFLQSSQHMVLIIRSPGRSSGIVLTCQNRFHLSRPIHFPVVLVVKNPPANAGDIRDSGSIPGLGRSCRGGHGNPLQYSRLENPMDRGAWKATVHRVTKSQTQLK